MKNWKLVLLGTMVSLLAFVASASAASACNWGLYQPRLPKKLVS